MAKNLEIDLHDPAVQNLLGTDTAGLATPDGNGKRTLMRVAGDEEGGIQSAINLEVGKSTVAVWYPSQELLLELDVFALPGEPVKLHMICPRCHKHLTISAERKHIEWDPRAANPMCRLIAARLPPASMWRARLGKISVETFECTWELNGNQKVSGDLTIGKGNLCKWRGAIDNNRVKED